MASGSEPHSFGCGRFPSFSPARSRFSGWGPDISKPAHCLRSPVGESKDPWKGTQSASLQGLCLCLLVRKCALNVCTRLQILHFMATFREVFFPQSQDSRVPTHPAQPVVPLPGGGKRSHWPAERQGAARSCPLGHVPPAL